MPSELRFLITELVGGDPGLFGSYGPPILIILWYSLCTLLMLLSSGCGAARGRASWITRSYLLSNTLRSWTNGTSICYLSLLFFLHLLLEKLKTLTDIIFVKWIIFFYSTIYDTSRLPFIIDVVLRLVKHFPHVFVILLLAGALVNGRRFFDKRIA